MFHAVTSEAKSVDSGSKTPAQQHPPVRQRIHGIGNQALLRMALPIQTKLLVNQPGDSLEQEADHAADKVMRGSDVVQRKCSCGGTCSECQSEHVQMKPAGSVQTGATEAPPAVHQALRSPAHPLPAGTRNFMENRFGRDFSSVQVHTGQPAETAAEALFAQAFTSGNHIVFGAGRYRPEASDGQQLLAHELAHVVQQGGGPAAVQRQPDPRWKKDVKAARYRGTIMANRILKHGLLSDDARAKMISELGYFEGDAWQAYSDTVRPALRAVTEIDMTEPAKPPDPKPAPKPPEKPPEPPCSRLPEAGPGKKCHFYVYDSTLGGALGTAWRWGANADSRLRSNTWALPSGDNMEEALFNILSLYAEKDCDCTDEVQFWGHGSSGNGGYIADAKNGKDEIETADFNIPGLDKFGDDRSKPGYQEWESKLTTFQRRLMLLRRTICDSDSTIYYRSCEAFHGQQGIDFAKASSKFWRCDVSGHTKSIGLSQPGKHTLEVCQEPDWDPSEGGDHEAKKGKHKLREIKPK